MANDMSIKCCLLQAVSKPSAFTYGRSKAVLITVYILLCFCLLKQPTGKNVGWWYIWVCESKASIKCLIFASQNMALKTL